MRFSEIKARYGVKSWRKVRGFDDYRITSCGRVWSCNKGDFIRQDYNLDSYLRVELYKDGKRHRRFVHRLVAEHYKKNPDPDTYIQVNHIDYDRHNNHVSNLEHVTPSINVRHAKQKHLAGMQYLGAGRWRKLSYLETVERAGTPF